MIGLGNVLMGDDALGPTVIGALDAQYEFPPEVAVLDLGTPGLDLTPYLFGFDAAVVVDTVSAPGAAGAIVLYRREEILKTPPQPRLSPHDPGLKEALLTVAFAGDGPQRGVAGRGGAGQGDDRHRPHARPCAPPCRTRSSR